MGSFESIRHCTWAISLTTFVSDHRLGIVLGADGMLRLAPGLVRIPNLSFISWDRLPTASFREKRFGGLPRSCG